jgi:hypothetical protein
MGDRAHIVVKSGDSKVYLYTHWRGSDLPKVVRAGLLRASEREGGQRLADGPYLTRMLFCDLIDGDVDGSTGFGIASTPCEDTSRDVLVDVDAQTVKLPRKKAVSIRDFVVGA